MALTNYKTITVASCFICPIEYGDYTGLSDSDELLLTEYLDCTVKLNTVFDYADNQHFARCAITGLIADCVDVDLYIEELQQ